MADQQRVLHLFEAYGIELEYMIVDRRSLVVKPITDVVMEKLAGTIVNEVELGPIAWSNELVMHVIELKSNGPSSNLSTMHNDFQLAINRMNELLAKEDAMLLPTAMHPFFSPERETKLWPYDNREIYAAYDSIFDCRGHGWSNLQSIHINLPFSGDEEFGRLHAAIRLVLPLLPALAASSPLVEEKATGFLDNRLRFYQKNQQKLPSIAGCLIPERVYSFEGYQQEVLGKMYQQVAPYDPKQILQEEWLNSRGAIARFERNAIEIRLLDIQESLGADFAVIAAVVSLVQALVDEFLSPYEAQKKMSEHTLARYLNDCIEKGENAMVAKGDYLSLLGLKDTEISAGQIWRRLASRLASKGYPIKSFADQFEQVTQKGSLASRILQQTGKAPKHEKVLEIYHELASHLGKGTIYA